jgi:5-methylcytosine-specific restriction endonuclease McrA
MNSPQIKNLTFKKIINSVCRFYNISPSSIFSHTRKKDITRARQIVAYLTREKLKESYPTIGRRLGDLDHTTILYSYQKIKGEIEKNEDLNRDINFILDLINEKGEFKTNDNKIIQSSISRKKIKKPPFLIKSLEDFPRQGPSASQLSRQFDILKKYKEGWTLQEIGREYKLTRERVRQIVERGLFYDAREIIKQGFVIDLNEFLKEEKRKHLLAMKIKHGIPIEQIKKPKKEKRWSKYYDCCRKCGTVIIPHHSHGYCKKCYPKTEIFKEMEEASRLRNIEKRRKYVNEYSKKYSKRPEVIERRRKRWDLEYFGGNREKALLRDREQCQLCGLSRKESYEKYGKDLCVVHIEGKENNSLKNLITLCRRCFNLNRRKLKNLKLQI